MNRGGHAGRNQFAQGGARNGGGQHASRGGHESRNQLARGGGQGGNLRANRRGNLTAESGTNRRGGQRQDVNAANGSGTRGNNLNGATGANVNANANVNNVNVNRNVNVNVDHDVDVHGVGYWGHPAVAAPHYYWPHGYHYVHAPVGYVLPHAFLTANYFYTAWASLGLLAPAYNQQWVRYGPDLLLVDQVSGQVIDVRYGVFQQ